MSGRSRRLRACILAGVVTLALPAVATAALVSYTYDPTGRLTTALYDTGLCLTYSYDPVGNRLTVASTTSSPATWGSGVWGCFRWIP
jgi:YD repeat-containing protein